MRKQKTIKIDKREITVKELRVRDILDILEISPDKSGAAGLLAGVENFLPRCTDVKLDDLKEMAPSEIRLIYEAFREVNADFFELARGLGLGDFLAKIRQSVVADFSALLAGSLKPGTTTH